MKRFIVEKDGESEEAKEKQKGERIESSFEEPPRAETTVANDEPEIKKVAESKKAIIRRQLETIEEE